MTTTEIDRFNKLICLNRKGLLVVVKRNVTDVLCNQSPQTRQTPLPAINCVSTNDVSKTTYRKRLDCRSNLKTLSIINATFTNIPSTNSVTIFSKPQ